MYLSNDVDWDWYFVIFHTFVGLEENRRRAIYSYTHWILTHWFCTDEQIHTGSMDKFCVYVYLLSWWSIEFFLEIWMEAQKTSFTLYIEQTDHRTDDRTRTFF